MSDITKFRPTDDQPHISAMMRCDACEHVAVHVYPASTPQRLLHCQCGAVGHLVVMRESPVMETAAAIGTMKSAASGLSPEGEAAVLMPYYKCLQLLHSRDREIRRLAEQLEAVRNWTVGMIGYVSVDTTFARAFEDLCVILGEVEQVELRAQAEQLRTLALDVAADNFAELQRLRIEIKTAKIDVIKTVFARAGLALVDAKAFDYKVYFDALEAELARIMESQ